jgi:ABC-2 type transport system ATP-binding protein
MGFLALPRKSTLLRLLAGIEEPSTGRMQVDGRDVAVDYRDCIGHLPQRPRFYEHLTVRGWLRYFSQLKALPPQLIKLRIDDLLAAHDLWDLADRKIAHLSGGYANIWL